MAFLPLVVRSAMDVEQWSRSQLYAVFGGFFLLAGLLAYQSSRPAKKVYPNAPWLTLSDLPGAAGEAADAQAFVQNGHAVIVAGYQKVSASPAETRQQC